MFPYNKFCFKTSFVMLNNSVGMLSSTTSTSLRSTTNNPGKDPNLKDFRTNLLFLTALSMFYTARQINLTKKASRALAIVISLLVNQKAKFSE